MARSGIRLKPASSAVHPDYPQALAAANRFLQAWQSGDQETALLMLSDAAKQHTSEQGFMRLFFGRSPKGYEMARGQKLGPGRYSFPVVLFENSERRSLHPRRGLLVLIKTGKEDWAIDKLP